MPFLGLTKIQQSELKNRRQPKYFLCLTLDVFTPFIVGKDASRYNLNPND